MICSGCKILKTKPHTTPKRFFLLKKLKSYMEGEFQKERDTFQSWAEFQGRGFERPQYTRSWLINKYGDIDKVLECDIINTPTNKQTSVLSNHKAYFQQALRSPNEVLVKVHATSLNPIDIRIAEGYGKNLFNVRRNFVYKMLTSFKDGKDELYSDAVNKHEFPLVLGRDFSGTVVDVGVQVGDLQPGDEVYGAPEVFANGSLSHYCRVDLDHVVQKPAVLSHLEAASIPYVGLTTVSALRKHILNPKVPRYALVLGGSGGVGSFAIQYLRAHGFSVTTTCSTEGMEVCQRLSADCINYKTEDVDKELASRVPYGIVYDVVGAGSPQWASQYLVKGGVFVTLKNPVAEMTDKYGAFFGLQSAALDFVAKQGQNMDIKNEWAFYKPDRLALLEIARLIDGGQIKPVIDTKNICSFDDVPKGFKALKTGRTKGKIVVNVSGLPEATQKPNVDKIIHL